MKHDEMTIGQLADAAGLSRRAIRFYVQRGLLARPTGRGRASAYGAEHLERLRRIRQLQDAGHSLEAVRSILDGREPPASPARPAGRRARARATISAELWTRLRLADGIELHYDATKLSPTAEELLTLRQAIRAILGADAESPRS